MAVSIYRFRKPELAVTLTSGGSLVANTTYYLTGVYNKNWTYNSVFSAFADVVSFTTDTTNKSVSVYWKTTVPIQSFADAGGGKIRVTAASHCLVAGNTLIIESGVYAGTYTVNTWESYHTFLIVGTYSTDYATTFRVESLHNTMVGLMLYMSPTAPFSGDPTADTWVGSITAFSHYPWQSGYTTNNIAITTAPTTTLYGTHAQIEMSVSPPAPWSAVLTKGKVWVHCTGTSTAAEIKQAFIDADVTDVCYLNSDTLYIYGILQSASGVLTLDDLNIEVHSGMFGAASNKTQLVLNRCSLSLTDVPYGAYMLATATTCNFFYKIKTRYAQMSTSSIYSYPIGTGNSFVSSKGMASENMVAHTINNMKVVSSGATNSTWFIPCSTTMTYNNCEILNGFVYVYYMTEDREPVNGLRITSPLAYDISVQALAVTDQTVLRLINIDTPRTNNRKVTYSGYAFQVYSNKTDINYYRQKTLTVTDENGTVVSGAAVVLKDGDGVTYNYTTDVNGQCTYKVIEQKSLRGTTGNYFTEVYSDNWTLSVAKTGYNRYDSKTVYAYLLEEEVALTPATYGDTTIIDSTLIDTVLY